MPIAREQGGEGGGACRVGRQSAAKSKKCGGAGGRGQRRRVERGEARKRRGGGDVGRATGTELRVEGERERCGRREESRAGVVEIAGATLRAASPVHPEDSVVVRQRRTEERPVEARCSSLCARLALPTLYILPHTLPSLRRSDAHSLPPFGPPCVPPPLRETSENGGARTRSCALGVPVARRLPRSR